MARPLLFLACVPAALLAGLNAYQAITGRRVSKKPSRRDDATMRRQSVIAATALTLVVILGIAVDLTG